jgi:hypothetical protein
LNVPTAPSLVLRLLLGLVTALIVARPMVPGDDPGLLSPLSHPAGLVITLGWFIVLAGWAAWRAWKSEGTWITSGGADLVLLAVAALFFLSTFSSVEKYRQPAWLISWEWLGFALVFFLIRQLARSPEDNHAMFCALLACAVSVAVQGLFQWAFELPSLRDEIRDDPAALGRSLTYQYAHVETEDSLYYTREAATNTLRPAGTFMDPDNFAGFLILLLPGLVGLALSAGLVPATRKRAVIIAACALVTLAALAFAARFPPGETSRLWGATWAALQQHPWLGLGPGNLARNRSSVENAGSLPDRLLYLDSARNFVFEIMGSAGVVTVLGFFTVLALVGWKIRRHWRSNKWIDEPLAAERVQRWEFMLGGVAGLLIAYLLRVPNLRAEQIMHEGWMCGLRAMIWIIVFAVCYATGASRRLINASIVIGLVAFLIHSLIAGSISAPGIGQPFWVMMALAMNTLPAGDLSFRARAELPPHGPLPRLVPLLVTAVVLLVFVVFVFFPVTRSAMLVAKARSYYEVWETTEKPTLSDIPQIRALDSTDPVKLKHARGFLQHRIVGPLKEAARANPGDAYVIAELAYWLRQQLELSEGTPRSDENVKLYNQARDATGSPDGSPHAADGAQRLDPRGKEGYLAEYHLYEVSSLILRTWTHTLEAESRKLREDAQKATKDTDKEDLLKRAAQREAKAEGERRADIREVRSSVRALSRMFQYHPETKDPVPRSFLSR